MPSRPNNYDVFAADPKSLVRQGNISKQYNENYVPPYSVKFLPDRSASEQAFNETFGGGVGVGQDGLFREGNVSPEQRAAMAAFWNDSSNYGPQGVVDPTGPAVSMIRPVDPFNEMMDENASGQFGQAGRYHRFLQDQSATRPQSAPVVSAPRGTPLGPMADTSMPVSSAGGQGDVAEGIENPLLAEIKRQQGASNGRWVMSGNVPAPVKAQVNLLRAQDAKGGAVDPELFQAQAEMERVKAAKELGERQAKNDETMSPQELFDAARDMGQYDPEAAASLSEMAMNLLRQQQSAGQPSTPPATPDGGGVSGAAKELKSLSTSPILQALGVGAGSNVSDIGSMLLKRSSGPGALGESDLDVLANYLKQRQVINPEMWKYGMFNPPSSAPNVAAQAAMSSQPGQRAEAIRKAQEERIAQINRDKAEGYLQSAFGGW